jgi:hypothetical protein
MTFIPDIEGNLAGRGGGTAAQGKGSEALLPFLEGDVAAVFTVS